MNILSFTDAEKYLMNKQVYFRKEIANSDLKTISNFMHDLSLVDKENNLTHHGTSFLKTIAN